MTTYVDSGGAGRTPWHLWVVGVLSLLWNGYGGYDYTMTNLQGEAYLRGMGFTEPQIAYFDLMPSWMTAVWAIGVWGAVLGSLLLLLRRKWAVYAFAASLLAVIVSLIYSFVLSDASDVMGTTGMVMNVVITVAAIFFLLYSRRLSNRGVLR